MRVLCINSKGFINPVPPLEEGKVYEVVEEYMHDEIPSYVLAEFGTKYGYSAYRFVPCSDQENVVLEESKLEIVN